MTAHTAKNIAAVGVSMSILACLAWAPRAAAAEKVSARSLPEAAAISTGIVSNTVAVVEIPLSVFVDRPHPEGRDPFFPDASYRKQLKKEPVETPVKDGDIILANLKLTGFGGIGKKRWAMVNGVSIYEGEMSNVRIGGNLHKIVCLEMKDQSVMVGIKDNPARRELKLDK